MFTRIPQRLTQRLRPHARLGAFRTAGKFTGAVTVGTLLGGMTFVSCISWPGIKEEAPPFDIKSIRRDIEEIIQKNNAIGPSFVRLAWQEAAMWDSEKKDGSPNSASMRLEPICQYAANRGLDTPRDALEPLKKKYPEISYADLWVLAAYVAIEYMGGPAIDFRWGRVDVRDPSPAAVESRLMDGSETQQVRSVFTRLGFNDQETVALIGAHTCGECREENGGYRGPWNHERYSFDNLFFISLLEEEWELDADAQRMQFRDRETKHLVMLPSDMVLRLDPKYRTYVDMYAKDSEKFFADFAAAFQKLTELGQSQNLKLQVSKPAPQSG